MTAISYKYKAFSWVMDINYTWKLIDERVKKNYINKQKNSIKEKVVEF
jgi:hypothetical protein